MAFISSSKLVIFCSFKADTARSLFSACLAFSSILSWSAFAVSFTSYISCNDLSYLLLSSSSAAACAAIFWLNFSFSLSLAVYFLPKSSTHFYDSYNCCYRPVIISLFALSFYFSSSIFLFRRAFSLTICLALSCLSFLIFWASPSAFSALSVSS